MIYKDRQDTWNRLMDRFYVTAAWPRALSIDEALATDILRRVRPIRFMIEEQLSATLLRSRDGA